MEVESDGAELDAGHQYLDVGYRVVEFANDGGMFFGYMLGIYGLDIDLHEL